MANQLVTKIAEKVWVETQMGSLEDWLPFAEYAVNEVIAVEHSVRRTALQVRILNAMCYGMTTGSLLWLLFGSR